jgi:hypothetical protein
MSIPVGQERFKTELKIEQVAKFVRFNLSQTVGEVAAAAAWNGHGTCYSILYDDLNMSLVTQHSVPRVLAQDQSVDRMST